VKLRRRVQSTTFVATSSATLTHTLSRQRERGTSTGAISNEEPRRRSCSPLPPAAKGDIHSGAAERRCRKTSSTRRLGQKDKLCPNGLYCVRVCPFLALSACAPAC